LAHFGIQCTVARMWVTHLYSVAQSEIEFCPTLRQISKFKPNRSFVANFIPLYGACIQCIVNGEENLQNYSFPLGLCYPAGDDRATAIGNMPKNFVKIARVVREISWRTDRQTDRHTQTDVLITILHHRSCGRSKYGLIRRTIICYFQRRWTTKFTIVLAQLTSVNLFGQGCCIQSVD